VSLLEAFEKIENLTGKVMKYALLPQREGDHQVYITDFEKFQSHYDWNINIDLDRIFGDIYTWLIGNNMKES
jgi:UDP-glucose 4-epimerase